ncbi:MAG: peptidase domain-containing ABC transporter [Holophagales bacterium]|nr:peptidase domain-containing ABC transporter [Holophagales bacterium]
MSPEPRPSRRRAAASEAGLLRRFPGLARLKPAGGLGRRIPLVHQGGGAECGAACLAMVLAFHGKHVPLDELRDAAGVDRSGADARGLLEAALGYGLRGRGVRVENPEHLAYLDRGTLLHWNFDHWVVLDRLDASGAHILDPLIGRVRVSREELHRSFTGVALVFRTGDAFEPGGERRRGARRYLSMVLGQGHLLGRILVVSVLVQALGLAVPLLTGLLVDRVVPRQDYRLLAVLGAGVVGIVLFDFFSTFLRAHLVLHLRTRLDAEMTLGFLGHLIGLPYAYFQRRSAGDLMMRLNSNTTIREILTSSAISGLLDGALVSLYFLALFASHAGMGVLVASLGLSRVFLFLSTRRRYRDLMSELLQTQARSRNYQVQMLAGIETLKAMGTEQRAVDHWADLFVDELNVSLAQGRLSALFDSLLGALTKASPFAVLLYGAVQVLGGGMSLGLMLALSALATNVLTPLSTLVSTALQLELLGSYLDRIDDVLETPAEQERSTVRRAHRLGGQVALDHVSFRYGPSSPPAVDGVSSEIEAGSFVALVGASGAGKSTLAHLLLGLHRPTSGRVLYDGVDLATLELGSVRQQVGIVPQHPYLFGATIRENIALVHPDLPHEQIVEAARQAQIHQEIAALPLGYDTVLSESGASLSGGQRQRLALARALVRRPAVLLLDEATSALDAVTERHIQEQLEALDCTRLVIAHRLSTVAAADRILVMDAGRIVEEGNHTTLLALGGTYAELVATQLRGDREPSSRAGPRRARSRPRS